MPSTSDSKLAGPTTYEAPPSELPRAEAQVQVAADRLEVGPAANRDGQLHRIVVVGGGAGGLELVTRLGDKLGRRGCGGDAGRASAYPLVEATPA
jgi:hypothetical protein